jgi:hypothetical protein
MDARIIARHQIADLGCDGDVTSAGAKFRRGRSMFGKLETPIERFRSTKTLTRLPHRV